MFVTLNNTIINVKEIQLVETHYRKKMDSTLWIKFKDGSHHSLEGCEEYIATCFEVISNACEKVNSILLA
jgi:hypothetical protein